MKKNYLIILIFIVVLALISTYSNSSKWVLFKGNFGEYSNGEMYSYDVKMGEFKSKENCMGERGKIEMNDDSLDGSGSPYFCGRDCDFGENGNNRFLCKETCGKATCSVK